MNTVSRDSSAMANTVAVPTSNRRPLGLRVTEQRDDEPASIDCAREMRADHFSKVRDADAARPDLTGAGSRAERTGDWRVSN